MSVPYGMRVRLNATRARLERRVRHALFGGTPTWKRRPNALPWFDQPDALAHADRMGADGGLLRQWVRDGYVIVRDRVDPRDIDEMLVLLDRVWDASDPIAD